MLTTAGVLLAVAVIAGCGLALWHMGALGPGRRPPLVAGVLHGLVGIAGFLAVLVALDGPPRGVAAGAGSFGLIAAVLFAVSILVGVVVLVRRRAVGVALAVHAGAAITGYALFLAWSALG